MKNVQALITQATNFWLKRKCCNADSLTLLVFEWPFFNCSELSLNADYVAFKFASLPFELRVCPLPVCTYSIAFHK